MNKRVIAAIICVATLVFTLPAPAFAAEINGKYISSQGACVMDYETGDVLYEHYGNISRVPASMTKLMTMYCVYEALENGEISLDTVVPISENVYKIARIPGYSNVTLYYDTVYTVDEMLDVLITYSANAVAVALAELISGSEEAFVLRMNLKVIEMGIDAYFYDTYGIADNQITPIAMARLARSIIKDYPDVLERSSQRSVVFHGRVYNSTNRLFNTYYYEGADGLKTGTTSAAGYCFCGTAKRGEDRVIAVTMCSSSGNQRFIDVSTMLDYGFEAIKNRLTLAASGAEDYITDIYSDTEKIENLLQKVRADF